MFDRWIHVDTWMGLMRSSNKTDKPKPKHRYLHYKFGTRHYRPITSNDIAHNINVASKRHKKNKNAKQARKVNRK